MELTSIHPSLIGKWQISKDLQRFSSSRECVNSQYFERTLFNNTEYKKEN